MAIITLHNMRFYAYHGYFDFEKKEGNTFIVSLAMELDTSVAGKSDNLEDTLNYQEVYDVVKKEMEISSNLIEHVAQRVMNSLKNKFPEIIKLEVELSKLNPPLGGKVDSVSIKLES